jgi:hypothetical protein
VGRHRAGRDLASPRRPSLGGRPNDAHGAAAATRYRARARTEAGVRPSVRNSTRSFAWSYDCASSRASGVRRERRHSRRRRTAREHRERSHARTPHLRPARRPRVHAPGMVLRDGHDLGRPTRSPLPVPLSSGGARRSDAIGLAAARTRRCTMLLARSPERVRRRPPRERDGCARVPVHRRPRGAPERHLDRRACHGAIPKARHDQSRTDGLASGALPHPQRRSP